jgi:hypothetical protein
MQADKLIHQCPHCTPESGGCGGSHVPPTRQGFARFKVSVASGDTCSRAGCENQCSIGADACHQCLQNSADVVDTFNEWLKVSELPQLSAETEKFMREIANEIVEPAQQEAAHSGGVNEVARKRIEDVLKVSLAKNGRYTDADDEQVTISFDYGNILNDIMAAQAPELVREMTVGDVGRIIYNALNETCYEIECLDAAQALAKLGTIRIVS